MRKKGQILEFVIFNWESIKGNISVWKFCIFGFGKFWIEP